MTQDKYNNYYRQLVDASVYTKLHHNNGKQVSVEQSTIEKIINNTNSLKVLTPEGRVDIKKTNNLRNMYTYNKRIVHENNQIYTLEKTFDKSGFLNIHYEAKQ